MKNAHYPIFAFLLIMFCSIEQNSFASDCQSGDKKLQQNISLNSLCPNGFTHHFTSNSVSQAIKNNQSNAQMITAAAQQYSVPLDLALAVSYQESRMQSCAGSPTGVKGPMQLTVATGKFVGYNRNINSQNILGGMATLHAAISACGTTNFACLSSHYNGSNSKQQKEWKNGVRNADKTLKGNTNVLASACGGSLGTCKTNPLTAPNNSTGTTTPVATPVPTTNYGISPTPLMS